MVALAYRYRWTIELFFRWIASGFSNDLPPKADLIVPFFKTVSYPLGVWGFMGLTYIVIVGSSNAVNLTDGLDGLAISTFATVAATFTALSYVTGHRVLAEYLMLVRFPQSAELTVFCGALVGASLGFLWYNAYPAEIFMGDVGSLALGGAIGTVAILIKQELLLIVVGGIFVIEALSVLIQVIVFKRTRRRVFLMAPVHHHFEMAGWSETKIIVRFWLVALMFAGIAGIAAYAMVALTRDLGWSFCLATPVASAGAAIVSPKCVCLSFVIAARSPGPTLCLAYSM